MNSGAMNGGNNKSQGEEISGETVTYHDAVLDVLPKEPAVAAVYNGPRRLDLYGDGLGFVELDQSMGGDITVVNAARVSFGKKKMELDDADKKLIKYLIKHKHTSTLEHNLVTFRMRVPLFIRSQHHRHRTWAYNEESRRYHSGNMDFYIPAELKGQHENNRQASSDETHKFNDELKILMKSSYLNSKNTFDALLSQGISRETARMVLPQSMYTEYIGTVNLNNLIKFFSLRIKPEAQWEIQQLAIGMLWLIAQDNVWPYMSELYIGFNNYAMDQMDLFCERLDIPHPWAVVEAGG